MILPWVLVVLAVAQPERHLHVVGGCRVAVSELHWLLGAAGLTRSSEFHRIREPANRGRLGCLHLQVLLPHQVRVRGDLCVVVVDCSGCDGPIREHVEVPCIISQVQVLGGLHRGRTEYSRSHIERQWF